MYVVQCFELFPGILYCNFFDFYVQLFTAIFNENWEKCKSVTKKRLYKSTVFQFVLFSLTARKRAT